MLISLVIAYLNRKEQLLFTLKTIEKSKYKNFYIPCPEVEVPFIIQRRIFKGDLQIRHLEILKSLKNKNIKIVHLYSHIIFQMFQQFGNNTDKHLPLKYYCKNQKYI